MVRILVTIAALSEDPTVKSADKAKLKGYYRSGLMESICLAVHWLWSFLLLAPFFQK